MEIIRHYLTKNRCYKKAAKMTPKGIVVHSTGCNNKNVTRYVDMPSLGTVSSNHWNSSSTSLSKCVHGIIGWSTTKKKVVVVNTLPYSYKPWGCASGKNGSYNNSHIQFEMCEDAGKASDSAYFKEAYAAAVEYCAHLCKLYKLDVSTIVSHKEAHDKGYASNHGDADSYFKVFGKTMNDFRKDVKKKLDGTSTSGSTSGSADKSSSTSGSVESAKYKSDKYKHTYVVKSDDGFLTLRAGAGRTKREITRIPTGSEVKCYGYYNLDAGRSVWLFVSYGTYTGYVHYAYLKEK